MKPHDQIDEALVANYKLYIAGVEREDNFEAFLSCLCQAFGTEVIANRMIKLGLID